MRSNGIRKVLFAALVGGLVATAAEETASAQVKRRDHRANPRTGAAEPSSIAPRVRSLSSQSGSIGVSVTVSGVFPAGTRLLLGGKEVAKTGALARALRFKVPPRALGPQPLVLELNGQQVPAGEFIIEGPPGTVAPIPRDHRGGGSDSRGDERDHRGDGDSRAGGDADHRMGDHRSRKGEDHLAARQAARSRGRALVTDFAPRGGEAGTVVTVRGRRLDNDVQLVVNGQVVPPRGAATPGAVQFAIPEGTATGQATLALRQGRRKDTVIGSFTVTPKPSQWKDEREARRRSWRKEAQREWTKRQRQLAKDEAARREALRKHEEELLAARAKRRADRQAALKVKWEAKFLTQENVRAELALHAERVARLERMLRLAEAGAHGDLVVRVRVLIKREDFRHDRRMEDLRAVHRQGE